MLPPRRDWAVETSRRFPLADESKREWSVLERFSSREKAVEFCHAWRSAEAWLVAREDAGMGEEPIFFNPINEMRRLTLREKRNGRF